MCRICLHVYHMGETRGRDGQEMEREERRKRRNVMVEAVGIDTGLYQ